MGEAEKIRLPAIDLADKQSLRARMRARLASLGALERSERSAALLDRLARSISAAGLVLAFHPLAGEPDIRPFLDELIARGIPLGLPRATAGGLEFSLVRDLASLRPGPWGTLEPDGPPEPPVARPLVLVPGLAFDPRGGRLGRGGGFYDRYLARLRASHSGSRVIGLCFDFQIVERLPLEETDQAVDEVLTDRRYLRPSITP